MCVYIYIYIYIYVYTCICTQTDTLYYTMLYYACHGSAAALKKSRRAFAPCGAKSTQDAKQAV